LVLWRYVNFCEVFTCEIRDKLWLCKLVTYHIVNQLRRKLLSISQATCQYRNSKLPSVQTVINFHDQLRITQILWWVLDKLLIRNAFLIKLCQNIVTFLFFLQWTFTQWNVKQRLLRWLLPFVYLFFYFLQGRCVRFLPGFDILIDLVEECLLLILLRVRVFLFEKPGKLPKRSRYLFVFVVLRFLFLFSNPNIFGNDFASWLGALWYIIIWKVRRVWQDVSFLVFLP
jgi:hypothetical protein